jgi:uncharacterized protein (TIGR03067 family)
MGITLSGWLLVLTAGAGPLGDAAKKELAALDGDWVVQRIEAGGQKQEPDDGERLVLAVRGIKWSFQATGEELEETALDSTTDPKVIDFKDIRPGRGGKEREAIYKRDGDTLTVVVYQKADKKRPTTFDTPTEAGTVLFVLKRAKE